MSVELQTYLENALLSLQRLREQMEETQEYLRERDDMQMLIELIKEQLPDENSYHTTR